MTSMNISLPEQMKVWIEDKVRVGEYNNSSEYVRDLIRKDQQEKARNEAFRVAIEKGRESGTSHRTAQEVIEALKARLKAQEKA